MMVDCPHLENINPKPSSNSLLDGVEPTNTEVQHCPAFFAATFSMLCQPHFRVIHLDDNFRVWTPLRFILCDLATHREPCGRQEVRSRGVGDLLESATVHAHGERR